MRKVAARRILPNPKASTPTPSSLRDSSSLAAPQNDSVYEFSSNLQIPAAAPGGREPRGSK